MTDKIITRFAPSPTNPSGKGLTLGNARTALFSHLHAKLKGGVTYLRIEDSNDEKSNEKCLETIISDLNWLGIKFDVGPTASDIAKNIKNPLFFQSKKTDRYNEVIEELAKKDLVYEKDGAIFFRMSKNTTSFMDGVLGKISVKAREVSDFPIRRADGSHIFHLCVVVDDIDMNITDVVRGQDHALNTIKHIRIFEALGADIPKFWHLPLIMTASGKKMSKRDPDTKTAVCDYRLDGYSSEALINYLALLGWSPPEAREVFDMKYLLNNFDITKVSRHNAKFDPKKLLNTNKNHIQSSTVFELEDNLTSYVNHKDWVTYSNDEKDFKACFFLNEVVEICQPKCRTYEELFKMSKNIIKNDVGYDKSVLDKFFVDGNNLSILTTIYDKLSIIETWEPKQIMECMLLIAKDFDQKLFAIAQIIRVVITGNEVSPPIDITMKVIGKEQVLNRISDCLGLLVGDITDENSKAEFSITDQRIQHSKAPLYNYRNI